LQQTAGVDNVELSGSDLFLAAADCYELLLNLQQWILGEHPLHRFEQRYRVAGQVRRSLRR